MLLKESFNRPDVHNSISNSDQEYLYHSFIKSIQPATIHTHYANSRNFLGEQNL